MSTDTMNQFGYGYLAGVLDANPEATILQQNAKLLQRHGYGQIHGYG